jgi:hypothetical protein
MTADVRPVAGTRAGVERPAGILPGAALPGAVDPRPPVRTRPLLRLPAGWPIVALLAGFPIWWALGLAVLIYPLLAVPMLVHLWRRRPVKLPPGFGLWLLYLLWQVLSFAALGLNPPGMLPEPASGRIIGYAVRLGTFAALTVLLLYVGNLTERELPRMRLVRLLAWMFAVTVAGGLAGLVAPTFNFTSPFELLLPESIRGNFYVRELVHPAFSQVQQVLGFASPRPKAPFEYTNAWGNNVSIFAIWLVVLLVAGGIVRHAMTRWVLLVAALGIGAVPAIYSLNRGMWIGVGFAACYVAVRLALRQNYGPLGALILAAAVLTVAVAVTPLQDIVTGRLERGHSNAIRGDNSVQTLRLVNDSPVIGYGSTRIKRGSVESIAIGRSPQCPACGNFNIGSNGQLWTALMSSGYVGTALYLGFFLYLIWRYRNDVSPIGIAGSIVLWLTLIYSPVYDAFPSPLAFHLLSLALLWRNELDRAGPARPPASIPVLGRVGGPAPAQLGGRSP